MNRNNPTMLFKMEQLALDAFSSTGFLPINKRLIQELGFLDAGIISNYIDKHKYFKRTQENFDGWFFLRYEDQRNELNVSIYALQQAKKRFVDMGLLMVQRKGVPAMDWYCLVFRQLIDLIYNKEQSGGVRGQDPMDSGGQDPMDSGGHSFYNNKKENNKKGKFLEIFNSLLPDNWNNHEGFQLALSSYISHRGQKSKLTLKAIQMMSKKFLKYSPEIIKQALETSIENGWTGVFPESIQDKKPKNAYHSKNQDPDRFGL